MYRLHMYKYHQQFKIMWCNWVLHSKYVQTHTFKAIYFNLTSQAYSRINTPNYHLNTFKYGLIIFDFEH